MARNRTVTYFNHSSDIDVETAKEMAAVGIVPGRSFVGERFSMGGQQFVTTAEATAEEFLAAVEASGVAQPQMFRQAIAESPQNHYWRISTD